MQMIKSAAELIALRRDLHRHPEVGFNEHRTAARIADLLTAMGYRVATGIGGTGVVASLRRGASPRRIGLRAEMDAITIQERSDLPYASKVSDAMHACGHDGHTTMLLGAAAALAQAHDLDLDGTVQLIFQPAEEHGKGAQAMIDDGLLDRFPMDAVYGLHNLPGIAAGRLHTRTGPLMAGEDNFTILVRGSGGHAARPHDVIDPLVVAAEIITALQTVVARSVDPQEPAVLSCTDIQTDGTRNAIPTEVRISGDTRCFSPRVQELLERRIREISGGIAGAHGATCEVIYTHDFIPTVNDPQATATAVEAASHTVGKDAVDDRCAPILASEDFAVYGRHVPACFFLIGNGDGNDHGQAPAPLHSGTYDFNDDILEVGVAFHVNVVKYEIGNLRRRTQR